MSSTRSGAPWASSSTARFMDGLRTPRPLVDARGSVLGAAPGPLRFELADELHRGSDVLHRRLRQDPVAQVENVAGPRAGALEQLVDAGLQFRQGREQRGRVQ